MVEARRSRSLPATSSYYYRRPLNARELMPAVGVGVATGLVAFYFAKLLFQRTLLGPGSDPAGGSVRVAVGRHNSPGAARR